MTEHAPMLKLDEIVAILKDGDEEARLSAVRNLASEPADPTERRAVLEVLIDVMGDDGWQVRKEAVASVLSWAVTPQLAERLVEAMGEPDNIGRRNAVIEAVMRLGGICIDPLLVDLGKKPEYRKVLVDVLGTFGDTRVIPALGESLLDEDPNVRAAAMEQLASFSHEEVVPALRAALRSVDLLVVLAALDGLNRQKVVLPLAELQPLLEQTVLRPALMMALGHSNDVQAVPALIEGLIEKARGAREAALVGLFRLHSTLDAAGRAVIESAAKKLDEMAIRSSLRALMEATPPVRQATAALIGWSGRVEMTRPLLLALADSDAGVAHTTGLALLDLGVPSLTALTDMLPSLDPRSKGAVLRFFGRHPAELARLLSPELLSRLLEAVRGQLTDKNPQNAAAAAQAEKALAGLGEAAAGADSAEGK